MRVFDSFAGLAGFVLSDLRFPHEQAHKIETYGWAPALYEESIRTFADGRTARGIWRNGHSEAPELACFVADVDNANDARPMLTAEEFAARLGGPGPEGPAWFTYTSFSSRPEHPKFRAVLDTSRPLIRAEAAMLFVWMDHHVLNGQGDSSIYDSGDYLYGPPHSTEWQVGGAGALDVDAILAEVNADPVLSAVARFCQLSRQPT
jgi:hypothetical protein